MTAWASSKLRLLIRSTISVQTAALASGAGVPPLRNRRPHRGEELLYIGDMRIGDSKLGAERRLLGADLAVAAGHLEPGNGLPR
jgi:hypothetical protein